MSQITLRNVTKKYYTVDEETIAIKDVNLDIEGGEMIAIMGPSGSGKTTLLNIIGCLDNHCLEGSKLLNTKQGSYMLNGREVRSLSKDELAAIRNKTIGFVFQQFALIEGYTIMENLEIPLIYSNLHDKKHKRSIKEIRTIILDILDKLNIKNHANKYPSQLSGGQQQRVAIARALITNPDILIADEPTGALDQKTGEEVIRMLKQVNEEGKTVIIVTHDEKIAAHCKRRIDILDGEVVSDRCYALNLK